MAEYSEFAMVMPALKARIKKRVLAELGPEVAAAKARLAEIIDKTADPYDQSLVRHEVHRLRLRVKEIVIAEGSEAAEVFKQGLSEAQIEAAKEAIQELVAELQ